jgi:hypothetical protein
MFNPIDKLLRDDDLNALRKDRIASTKKRADLSDADLRRAAVESSWARRHVR